MTDCARKRPNTFCMMAKGCYTVQARSLACLLVFTGTTEAKVNGALVEIGEGVWNNCQLKNESPLHSG